MARALKARYRVRVAWDQNPVSLFTFGRSTFGGTDTLAASGWSQTFLGPYDDITNDGAGLHVDRISIIRGRDDDLAATQAGEVTVELTDANGKLNPRNTTGPLYGKLVSNRPLIVNATFDGQSATPATVLDAITDTTRRAAVQGDGRSSPDSSVGMWEPATNQCSNGGFESNTTGWATDPGGTIARDTIRSKFGGASGKITRGVTADASYFAITLPVSLPHVFSCWMWIPADYDGTAVKLQATQFAGGTIEASANLALRDQWQRVYLNFTPGGADLAGFILVQLTGATSGKSVWIDGVQAELAANSAAGPTPYVETDGATAARPSSGYNPPAIFNPFPAKGWASVRLRAGWPSTAFAARNSPAVFIQDALNATVLLRLYYTNGSWRALVNGVEATVADTFVAGDIRIVTCAWDAAAGTVKIWLGSGAAGTATGLTAPASEVMYPIALGNDGSARLNGDLLWAALGYGSGLTTADAQIIATVAPNDPLPSDLPAGAIAAFPFDTSAFYVPNIDACLIYAWTSQIQHSPGNRKGTTTIHAIDLMARMDEQKTALTSLGVTTTDAALGRLLDALQWTDPAMRNLSPGDQIPDFAPNGQNTLLNETESLIEPARGFFFIARQGVARFLSRDARSRALNVGKIKNVMRNLVGGTDAADVINQWKISRTDLAGNLLTVSVKSDQPSIDKYGFQGGSGVKIGEITTPYLMTVGQADNLASYMLERTKAPGKPIWELPIRANVDANTLYQCLTRDLNDRVTIQEANGNTAGDHFIEQIRHEITMGGARHDTIWKLTERPSFANPFTFGISRFGGPDRLDWY